MGLRWQSYRDKNPEPVGSGITTAHAQMPDLDLQNLMSALPGFGFVLSLCSKPFPFFGHSNLEICPFLFDIARAHS